MWVQLPELHPRLLCRIRHILLYQRLWLHRNQLPAGQGEYVFGCIRFSFFAVLFYFTVFVSLQVCVVGALVHPVGSEWEEGCEKCTCTQLQDKGTLLHIAQCTPPVCDRTCPRVRHTDTHQTYTFALWVYNH